MAGVTEGRLGTGQGYLKLGSGPPLVLLPGLSYENTNPTGLFRRMVITWCAPFAEHFTVYRVTRRPGGAPGSTMSELAADYATAIEREIGGPVALHGTSSGGSIALQLAVDHPHLVSRLVVAAAACRLSPAGRELNADVIRRTELGDHRGAAAALAAAVLPQPLAYPAAAVGWLTGSRGGAGDVSDFLIMLRAELGFDAGPGLGRVTARSLVLGGTADPWYTEELFRRTADEIPGGRAVLFRGKPHSHPVDARPAVALALGFLLG